MSQPIWIVICPHCKTENGIERAHVRVECGQASARCTCKQCRTEFPAQCDYLEWLGLVPGSERSI